MASREKGYAENTEEKGAQTMQRTSVAMLRKANFAFISSRILHVMGHYKVFDQMEMGPKTAVEIAAALNMREKISIECWQFL